MAQQRFEEEREHLSKIVPTLKSITGNPAVSQREAVIEFPNANRKNFPNLEKSLELYCWPDNQNPQRWVRDPHVDGDKDKGKMEGLWRFVNASGVFGRTEGVFLTLREGYASEIKWDEARVPSRDILPQTDNTPIESSPVRGEDYIDVLFPNFNPEESQKAADGLLALGTIEDPTVSTHDFEGVYHILRVRTREEDDGSHSVVAVLAQSRAFVEMYENENSHNAARVFYLHHVPKSIVQSIVDNPLYKTDGATATANYSTERATYDVIIRQGVDDPVSVISKKTEDGCQLDVYTDFYFGLTLTAAEAIPVGTAPQGWIYRIPVLTPAAHGRFNVRRDRSYATSTSGQEFIAESTPFHTTTQREKRNQLTPLTSGESVVGKILRALSRLNPFCVYDGTNTEIESIPWDTTFTIDGPDGLETHIVKKYQPVLDIGTPDSGFVFRLTGFAVHEDQTFDWHVVQTENLYAREVTNSWPYTKRLTRDLLITAGGNIGLYQPQIWVREYLYETRRFTSEDDAYAWLRESIFFFPPPGSGVSIHGRSKYVAWRQSQTIDEGWTNNGFPFTGE